MNFIKKKTIYALITPIVCSAAVILLLWFLYSLKLGGAVKTNNNFNSTLSLNTVQKNIQPINENLFFYNETNDIPVEYIKISINSSVNSANTKANPDKIKSLLGLDEPVQIVPASTDLNGFPYYCQADEIYASISYGNQTIKSYGCGPTNMAMIISALTDYQVDPVAMAKLSEQNGCFISGSGTSYAFFDIAAKKYGVNVTQKTVSKTEIIQDLKNGKLVMINVGPSVFTKRAHFLLIRGIASDGSILVADSGSRVRTMQSWTIDYLVSVVKQNTYWCFSA